MPSSTRNSSKHKESFPAGKYRVHQTHTQQTHNLSFFACHELAETSRIKPNQWMFWECTFLTFEHPCQFQWNHFSSCNPPTPFLIEKHWLKVRVWWRWHWHRIMTDESWKTSPSHHTIFRNAFSLLRPFVGCYSHRLSNGVSYLNVLCKKI